MVMFGLPYLNKYIDKIVKDYPISDTVDYLNYYITSVLLATFSFFISAKQYFGQPIQCWMPREFSGNWEKYAENYCFINNLYGVMMTNEIPSDLDERTDKLSYYRWVPIFLALQAMAFFIPNYLWNMLHKQTVVNPRAVVCEIKKCKNLQGNHREREVETLAQYISDTITVFGPEYRRTTVRNGWNATILYLFIKFLYLANIIGQLLIMDKFLGGAYLSWGYDTLSDVVQGKSWQESEIFPRVIMCDFTVRRVGNPSQRYSIQCVIMMNMINEKLYLFLYVWFVIVAVVTAINFLYYLFVLCFSRFRIAFIYANINKTNNDLDMSQKDFRQFVQEYLRPDGVLLLQFVRQHVGGRVTYDLVNQLLKNFKGKTSSIESSPQMKGTYKSTNYGPESLYPGYPSNQNESSDLDYIDNAATLPMGDQRTPIRPVITSSAPPHIFSPGTPSSGRIAPSAPIENQYSQLPPKTSV